MTKSLRLLSKQATTRHVKAKANTHTGSNKQPSDLSLNVRVFSSHPCVRPTSTLRHCKNDAPIRSFNDVTKNTVHRAFRPKRSNTEMSDYFCAMFVQSAWTTIFSRIDHIGWKITNKTPNSSSVDTPTLTDLNDSQLRRSPTKSVLGFLLRRHLKSSRARRQQTRTNFKRPHSRSIHPVRFPQHGETKQSYTGQLQNSPIALKRPLGSLDMFGQVARTASAEEPVILQMHARESRRFIPSVIVICHF